MNIILGLLAGIAAGAVQFRLLIAYNAGVTRRAKGGDGDTGSNLFMLAGVAQLIMPFAVLIIVAFIYTDALIWTGVGIATTLVLASLIKTLLERRRT